ncbi:MAG: hypothetical protein H6Q63_471, partial [Firmicutes bacterium]|nr:hypothetical protein [Bacillota bacterium]
MIHFSSIGKTALLIAMAEGSETDD